MRNKRLIFGILLGMVIGTMLSTSITVFADREQAPANAEALPLDELRLFSDVYSKIKEDYVEDVSDKKLIESAIEGMVTGLDPHSAFLDKEAFKELQIGTTGEFGGLGIEVGMENGFVKVVSPIDDTPAQKAGIKSGDLIIRIDNKPVKGMSLDDAVKLMRGKPGSKVTLTVVREGAAAPMEISIKRAVIHVKSVKYRMLESGYGYVRIASFQSRTAEDLQKALEALKKENKGDLKGLVLDLRNNPGGVLTAAVGVADAFLNKGLIVYTKGRIADSDLRYSASPGDDLDGAPMVVLVNGGSASASEIVSGALQDNKRALIVGTKTFGKGSVQTILPMPEGTALKLTTALYYTPSGRSIQAEGIVPNVTLDPLKVSSQKETFKPITEADLSGHLQNGNKKQAPEAKSGDDLSLAEKDYQLYEALNLLKGLSIYGKWR
ncbi:MAG: S41 family peptidase [Gammaproteobacteria bacterium]|jgi:carboxyl-terminal processing protease